MHLVDPLKQPQRFIQQADALVRQSFTQPTPGVDPFAVIDAHLEASFEAVLHGVSGEGAPGAAAHAGSEPSKGASGPVSLPGYMMGAPNGQMPVITGSASLSGVPMGGVNPMMMGGVNPMMPGGMNPMMPGGMNPMMMGGMNSMMAGAMTPIMNPMLTGAVNPLTGASAAGAAARPGVPMGAELEAMIGRVAAKHGVPDWLVRNVVKAESGGNPIARSPVGAMGLMQLMPGTAAELGVSDPFNPAENLDGGTRYLRQMLDRFGGDVAKAVAAYNAGPGAVEKHGGIPPYAETQAYVKRVLD
ncbi:MAG: lytic transglycosylase domain-containing protein [Candidatus Sericytochromatia bacterium]